MTGFAASGWCVALLLGWWALVLRARLEAVARADHELRGPVAALALAGAALARAPGMRERGLAVEGQVDRLRAALADLAAARRGLVVPRRLGVTARRLAALVRRRPAQVAAAASAQPPPDLPLEAAVRAAVAGWAPVGAVLGRRVQVDWRAGTAAAAIDRGRLAQSMGNVLANALEHGGGDVAVLAERDGGMVRIAVRSGAAAPGAAGAAGAAPARGSARPDRGRGLAIAAHAAEEAGGRLTFERDAHGAAAVFELPAAP